MQICSNSQDVGVGVGSLYSQFAEASGRFLYAHAEFPTWLLDIITVENGLEGLLATSKQLCVYVYVYV